MILSSYKIMLMVMLKLSCSQCLGKAESLCILQYLMSGTLPCSLRSATSVGVIAWQPRDICCLVRAKTELSNLLIIN